MINQPPDIDRLICFNPFDRKHVSEFRPTDKTTLVSSSIETVKHNALTHALIARCGPPYPLVCAERTLYACLPHDPEASRAVSWQIYKAYFSRLVLKRNLEYNENIRYQNGGSDERRVFTGNSAMK